MSFMPRGGDFMPEGSSLQLTDGVIKSNGGKDYCIVAEFGAKSVHIPRAALLAAFDIAQTSGGVASVTPDQKFGPHADNTPVVMTAAQIQAALEVIESKFQHS